MGEVDDSTADAPEGGSLPSNGGLSIGEISRMTGVSVATLRTWEQRHGFPEPHRLPSGHRRYDASVVEAVLAVLRQREAGVRLETAIAEAQQPDGRSAPSVFTEVRRRSAYLEVHRVRASTLNAITRAIEDEFCARADQPVLFAGFQQQRFYDRARTRWEDLARTARTAYAIADFDEPAPAGDRVVRVRLNPESPLRREWFVVCDAHGLPALLTAWELPGQADRPDDQREFEAIWTVDPRAVRNASRVCAATSLSVGAPGAELLVRQLAEPSSRPLDPAASARLFNRIVTYLDRQAR
jgi:MerR family transcriptional regulator, light-induced transcriptional regulator